MSPYSYQFKHWKFRSRPASFSDAFAAKENLPVTILGRACVMGCDKSKRHLGTTKSPAIVIQSRAPTQARSATMWMKKRTHTSNQPKAHLICHQTTDQRPASTEIHPPTTTHRITYTTPTRDSFQSKATTRLMNISLRLLTKSLELLNVQSVRFYSDLHAPVT